MYKQDSTGAVRQIAFHKIGTTHHNVPPVSVGVKPAGQTAVPIVNYTFGVVAIPLIMSTWGLLRCVWLGRHLTLPGKTFHLEYWNIYVISYLPDLHWIYLYAVPYLLLMPLSNIELDPRTYLDEQEQILWLFPTLIFLSAQLLCHY